VQQTFCDWELYIIEDRSKDDSYNLITQTIGHDERIHLIRNRRNRGPAYSRNKGISNSVSEYIAFIDCDDIWDKTKLEKQLSFMNDNSINISYTNYFITQESKHEIKKFIPRTKVNYKMLLQSCDIGCSTLIYNRDKLGNEYMEDILRGQDYTLWLKLLKKEEYAYSYPEYLTTYRIINGSLSRNKYRKAKGQWFIYRRVERLGILESIYYFIHYAYRGYMKNR
jgi:teichuronic acid biosynthesis glycosyltransferase TuaG